MKIDTISEKIATAVDKGLFKDQKSLPSWLFYDDNGDRIFQEIMAMPEYYLTKCELGILQKNKPDMLRRFDHHGGFQLIELGVGDGLKTEVLLSYFGQQKANFTYHPIDISSDVLAQLETRLKVSLPELSFQSHVGEYIEALRSLSLLDQKRKVLLFLGSNIGNFTMKDARLLLRNVHEHMEVGDLMLTGMDLKKSPALIKNAYDDPAGVTKRFNMNLLIRLNHELGANFKLENFNHFPTYDPHTGEAKSFLISRVDQQVYIEALNKTVSLNQWETIHTEVSIKYDQKMIADLADAAGFIVEHQYTDPNEWFTDVLFRKP